MKIRSGELGWLALIGVALGAVLCSAARCWGEEWLWERSLELDNQPPDLRLAVPVDDVAPVQGRTAAEPDVMIEPTDGGAVVAMDILRIGKSGRVPAAWQAVPEKTKQAQGLMKPLVAVWQTGAATLTTVAEPPRVWGEYTMQGGWKTAKGLAGGYAAVRGVQGKLDDDLEALLDVFDGGSDGDGPPKTELDPERPNIVAEKGAEVTVRDAPQTVLPTIQARDGSRVTFDFQRAE